MAGKSGVMPAASLRRRRPWVTVLVVALAAVVGAAVVYVVTRPGNPATPQPITSGPGTTSVASGDTVTACVGRDDPAAAAVAAMQAPATTDGAAQAAAGVVRFTESKGFAEPSAAQVIKQLTDPLSSAALAELQKGQAPYIAEMTASAAHVARGAFAVMGEMPTPTVTVLAPVDWSTAQAKHYEWHFVDVKLQRSRDRWTVVSTRSTARVVDGLAPLRGAAVQQDDLDRYGAALTVEGFRRYSGDC